MAAGKSKSGSLAEAQEQASIPPTVERSDNQRWAPGRYVLTVGRYQPVADGLDYVAGDVIELRESDAQRLGKSGVIAPVDSMAAKRAQAKTDEERSRIRAEELRAEADRLDSLYKQEQERDDQEDAAET